MSQANPPHAMRIAMLHRLLHFEAAVMHPQNHSCSIDLAPATCNSTDRISSSIILCSVSNFYVWKISLLSTHGRSLHQLALADIRLTRYSKCSGVGSMFVMRRRGKQSPPAYDICIPRGIEFCRLKCIKSIMR